MTHATSMMQASRQTRKSRFLRAVLRWLVTEAEPICPLRAGVPDVQRFNEAVTHEGSMSHRQGAVRFLLEEGADAPSWPRWADVDRFTAAAWRGDVKTMRRQVTDGQDLDARDRLGFTALMRAAIGGDAGAVRFLLERGADATLLSNRKASALALAELLRRDRTEELEGQSRSWKEQNPPHLDSRLKDFIVIVALLRMKSPAKARTAAPDQDGKWWWHSLLRR